MFLEKPETLNRTGRTTNWKLKTQFAEAGRKMGTLLFLLYTTIIMQKLQTGKAIAREGNWAAYKGWSRFEIDHVSQPYLETIMAKLDAKKTKSLVSVGCGPGYPECLLTEKGIRVFGFDNNQTLLQKAKSKGLETRLIDLFDIRKTEALRKTAKVVAVTFVVHNIALDRMGELYENLAYLLEDGGFLVTLDPHARYEHITAVGNTFRRAIDLEGRHVDPQKVDPDNDDYAVEIHLDDGTDNESIIQHQHRPLRSYFEAMKTNGFSNAILQEAGFQISSNGFGFPAYQIISAQK